MTSPSVTSRPSAPCASRVLVTSTMLAGIVSTRFGVVGDELGQDLAYTRATLQVLGQPLRTWRQKMRLSSSFGGDPARQNVGNSCYSAPWLIQRAAHKVRTSSMPIPLAIHGRLATTSRRQPPTPEAGGHGGRHARARKPPAQGHNRSPTIVARRAGDSGSSPPFASERHAAEGECVADGPRFTPKRRGVPFFDQAPELRVQRAKLCQLPVTALTASIRWDTRRHHDQRIRSQLCASIRTA